MVVKLDFITNRSYNFKRIINNNTFKIHLKYNDFKDCYYINIDKYENNSYINKVNGILIVCGIDLFLPFKYLGLGSLFVIPNLIELYDIIPNANNLIGNYYMLWEN